MRTQHVKQEKVFLVHIPAVPACSFWFSFTEPVSVKSCDHSSHTLPLKACQKSSHDMWAGIFFVINNCPSEKWSDERLKAVC